MKTNGPAPPGPAETIPQPAGPRVLFVSAHCPLDAKHSTYGGFLRQRTFIDGLIYARARITAFFILPPGSDTSESARLALQSELSTRWRHPVTVRLTTRCEPADLASRWSLIRSVVSPRYEPNFAYAYDRRTTAELARELAADFDLVFAQRVDVLIAVLRARPSAPVICDIDDVEHLKFSRQVRGMAFGPRVFLLRARVHLLRRIETAALGEAEAGLVCSSEDQAYLRKSCGLPNIVVVPNTVELPTASPPATSMQIAFIGTYTYEPNVEAAQYLVHSIWPMILAQRPDAHLVLAGNAPERLQFVALPPQVRLAGFVEDLDAFYAESALIVCPILNGGGTRIKIIEAAARGRTVVSTTIGAEGLEFVDGEEIVIADGAALLARRCVELLDDPDRSAKIGLAARAKARSRYDRRNVVKDIAQIVSHAASRR